MLFDKDPLQNNVVLASLIKVFLRREFIPMRTKRLHKWTVKTGIDNSYSVASQLLYS